MRAYLQSSKRRGGRFDLRTTSDVTQIEKLKAAFADVEKAALADTGRRRAVIEKFKTPLADVEKGRRQAVSVRCKIRGRF